MTHTALPKVCIIGAGTSGLIAAKVMKQRGIPFDCFEKGSGIGGLWRFNNDNGVSTCYRSLHINTAKRVMEVSDFPFPDDIPEYPSHQQILAYFENYCDHFGLRDKIRFKSNVRHVERLPDGLWQVDVDTPDGKQRHHYDMLLVANGHHWDPRQVSFPGHFDGDQFHSHHYVDLIDPVDLRGKNVLVVGSGNSAMDIVCELGAASRAADGPARVYLSQRSGVWITPKVLGNVPQDKAMRHPMKRPGKWETFRREWIPLALRRTVHNFVAETWVRMNAGDPSRVGLKQPRERFSERHNTISQDIHSRLIHGDIIPKGDIQELQGKQVRFEDGSVADVDVIIYCTGYNLTFPFFDTEFFTARNNDVALWQRMFDPRFTNLAFVALVQPRCAMMPIAELQSEFLADYLQGNVVLPSTTEMQREGRDYHESMKSRFTASASHTIQIDCEEYSYNLYKAWDKGRQEAHGRGRTLPVEPRAERGEGEGEKDAQAA